MAGAHDGHLGHMVVHLDGLKADGLLQLLQNGLGGLGVVPGHGEADVLALVPADGLQDDVYVDVLLGQQGENLKGDAGLIGQTHQGQAGYVLILGNAADVNFFHGFYNLLDFRAGAFR